MTVRLANSNSHWGDVDQLGRHHISTLSRYWLTRLYLACSILSPLFITWLEPEAITHRLINESGALGWYMALALGIVCVVGIVDVIINDILPDRYQLLCAKRHRHLIYMAMSIGTFSMLYMYVAVGGHIRWLILPGAVDGTVAAVVAVLDLFNRHRTSE